MTNTTTPTLEQLRDVFRAIECLVPANRAVGALSATGLSLCDCELTSASSEVHALEQSTAPSSKVTNDVLRDHLEDVISKVSQLAAMFFVIQGDGSEPFANLKREHRDNYIWLASEVSTEVINLLKSMDKELSR